MLQNSTESQTNIGDISAYVFTNTSFKNSKTIFIPYGNAYFAISTSKYDLVDIQKSINSFKLKF